jgi:hypothetical protein
MENTRVVGLVGPRKADSLWKLNRSVTCDLELDAVRVKLRASPWVIDEVCVALVERNEFGAEEVSSGCQKIIAVKTAPNEDVVARVRSTRTFQP